MTDTSSGERSDDYLDVTETGMAPVPSPGTASVVRPSARRSPVTERSNGARRPAASVAPAPFWGKRDTASGVARSVQLRTESSAPRSPGNLQVLSMRIEQYDERGNRIAPLPVEVRALHLRGQVAEGEEVVADGRWRRGTLSARRVTNVTTGATIQGAHLILRKVVPLVIAVIMLGGTLVAAGWFMRTMNDATVEAFAEANQDMSLNSGFGNDPFDSPGGRSDVAVEVTLPDLRGVDAVTAISRLEQLGLRWRALQERSPSVPYGRVLRTEPAQDERARTGSVVVVHVSGGP